MSVYNDSDLHAYFFKGCLGEGYLNLEDGLYVQDAKTNDLVVDVYDKDEDVKTPFWSGVEFYNKLYKEALDEAVEKWGDEDKDFYDNAVKFYQENNE